MFQSSLASNVTLLKDTKKKLIFTNVVLLILNLHVLVQYFVKRYIFSSITVGLSPSKKNIFFALMIAPSKMIKNAFYFILKVIFVLKIFKFLS